jgi:hypothetical protein
MTTLAAIMLSVHITTTLSATFGYVKFNPLPYGTFKDAQLMASGFTVPALKTI